mgnify:CR=1 FL=1
MKTDGILFDLDGTLWDSVPEILLTWNRVIAGIPGLRAPIDRREQESVMGLQMDEIARRLFPGQPSDRQTELMEACVQEENKYLYQHGGTLYPGVRETLTVLHKKFPLYIVSNCQSGYIEAFLHAHRLEDAFDGFTCYGDTMRSKGENMRALADQYGLRAPVYVGDTQGDLDAAEFAKIPFVYAAYGFGHPVHWDEIINQFSDLISLFE